MGPQLGVEGIVLERFNSFPKSRLGNYVPSDSLFERSLEGRAKGYLNH